MVGPFGLRPKQTMRSRALGLARPLVARGHNVRLLMPPWDTPEEADRLWVEDGVELRYVPLDGGTLSTARSLVRETLAWQPDIVHTFKPKAYSGLAAWWLWQFHRGRPKLFTDADDWEGWGGWNDIGDYTWAQKRFFAWQERWGLTHADRLTAASRTLVERATDLGMRANRITYIPNGPGIPIVEPTTAARLAARKELGLGERPVVLIYSRLFEFDTARLVAVLERTAAAVPDLAILFAGLGLYEADDRQFRQQLTGAGLAERVVHAGWVPLAKLPALLSTADVGLYLMDDTLLNRAKCPVKLVDLLVAGVPVVAEAVGQVTEYIDDGRTGMVATTGDVAALARATIRLLQNATERAAMGAAAREATLAHFRWATLSAQLEEVYLAAVS